MARSIPVTFAPIEAGTLNHRVTFLNKTIAVVHGITSEQWTDAFTCWADVQPISGREYLQAAASNREDTMRFTIRYRKDVHPEMRIRFRGMEYTIESILNPGMKDARLDIVARSTTYGNEADA